jgi:hypothetical protein
MSGSQTRAIVLAAILLALGAQAASAQTAGSTPSNSIYRMPQGRIGGPVDSRVTGTIDSRVGGSAAQGADGRPMRRRPGTAPGQIPGPGQSANPSGTAGTGFAR